MTEHNKNKLSLIWDRRQKDFVVKYPRRCDGALILNKIIGDILMWDMDKEFDNIKPCFKIENLKDELEKRGYDLTTLKFSIKLKGKDNE